MPMPPRPSFSIGPVVQDAIADHGECLHWQSAHSNQNDLKFGFIIADWLGSGVAESAALVCTRRCKVGADPSGGRPGALSSKGSRTCRVWVQGGIEESPCFSERCRLSLSRLIPSLTLSTVFVRNGTFTNDDSAAKEISRRSQGSSDTRNAIPRRL